jgi:hypothetical protein
MIYILKNTSNNIVLELSNIITIVDPYILFEFINESNVDMPKRYFTTPNISIYKHRYDEFLLVEADSGEDNNADNVPINLQTGQYRYNIYSSSSVIDVNDVVSIIANEPISTGRMLVSGTDLTVDPVYDSNILDATSTNVYD